MAMHGRGLVCLSMTEERLRQLGIPLMAPEAPSVVRRSYGASIEARRGVTTGISAHDRATTIQAAMAPGAGPGRHRHARPRRARSSAAAAACWCAPASPRRRSIWCASPAVQPAAAVCAILTDDGSLAEPADLEALAELFELKIVRIADLVAYRLRTESLVHRVAERAVDHPHRRPLPAPSCTATTSTATSTWRW